MPKHSLLTDDMKRLLWADVDNQRDESSADEEEDSGYGKSKVDAQTQPRRQTPQNIDEIDHPVLSPPSVEAFRAATPAVINMRRLHSLNALLPKGRDSLAPQDEVLRKLHHEAFSKIRTIVVEVIEATHIDRGRQAHFSLAVDSSQSFPLIECLFGTGMTSPEELMLRIYTDRVQSKQYPVSVGVALVALVGAAVFKWVFRPSQSSSPAVPAHTKAAVRTEFNREHDSHFLEPLFSELKNCGSIYMRLVSERLPELHDQLILESKCLAIEQGFDSKTHATTLASHTCEVLSAFLKENLPDLDQMARVQFEQGLKEVFILSLQLKAQTCLDPTASGFLWPCAEAPFDSSAMTTYDGFPHRSNTLIRFTIFPALTRVNKDTSPAKVVDPDRKETSIGLAEVIN
ncbi:MAG: hypothetical protein Q9226_002584 [Calogaya cf. arnoldii]